MNIRKYKPILGQGKVNVLVSDGSISVDNSLNLSTVDAFYTFACEHLHMNVQAEEYVYVIAMDSKNRPIGISEVGHGTVNACFVSVRSVMIRLLLMGSVKFMLLHNHPSGDPKISRDDKEITQKLKKAGELMDIELVDHLVIGADSYVSFAELEDW